MQEETSFFAETPYPNLYVREGTDEAIASPWIKALREAKFSEAKAGLLNKAFDDKRANNPFVAREVLRVLKRPKRRLVRGEQEIYDAAALALNESFFRKGGEDDECEPWFVMALKDPSILSTAIPIITDLSLMTVVEQQIDLGRKKFMVEVFRYGRNDRPYPNFKIFDAITTVMDEVVSFLIGSVIPATRVEFIPYIHPEQDRQPDFLPEISEHGRKMIERRKAVVSAMELRLFGEKDLTAEMRAEGMLKEIRSAGAYPAAWELLAYYVRRKDALRTELNMNPRPKDNPFVVEFNSLPAF